MARKQLNLAASVGGRADSSNCAAPARWSGARGNTTAAAASLPASGTSMADLTQRRPVLAPNAQSRTIPLHLAPLWPSLASCLYSQSQPRATSSSVLENPIASADLSWLDDASCRHTGGIGGCLLALSIWSWERLLVGRPKTVKYEDWDDKDDPLRLPTWAYKWDVLNETTDDPSVMYKLYKSELDAITPEQVEWEPYGKGESFGNPLEFRLNPMCIRDRDLWHMRCPLICNWAVELHLPHRVFRQFGLFQPHPPEWEDTDKLLHALDRKKQRKIKDWASHHRKYVVQFALSVEQARAGKRAQLREHCPIAFNNYLAWFLASTRVEVCQPAYAEEIMEEPTVFDEVAQHQYNALVRKGNSVIPSAPMMNFVRAQIKKAADETETILETTPAGKSDGEGALRENSLRFTSPSN
nr:uncharacterized protein LOC109731443 [Aegilops tauschii subsp. strangulata]